MRRLVAGLALLAALVPAAASARPASVIAMRGERRVLLLFAPSADDGAFSAQRDALAHASADLRERDVTIVAVAGDQVTGASDGAPSLRRRYIVAPGRFELLLIGKDGHVVLRRSDPIQTKALFATIDAMPMRRDEARAKR